MSVAAADTKTHFPASFGWGGYLLGFSIGGFFDGILLHQVLQWHHLLSGLGEEPFGELRFQILADGLFHALMYVLALVGLWLLWRALPVASRPGADRFLLANALIGFGVWHMVDGIMSHWVLGIHRIRMDSEMPLFWDLLWFVLFGVLFTVVGWLLRRGASNRTGGAAPAVLALVAILTGAGTIPRPADTSTVMVVFRPGVTPAQAFAAMAAADGRLVWSDPADNVWAVDLPRGQGVAELYRGGALLVSGSLLPLGCLDWFRN